MGKRLTVSATRSNLKNDCPRLNINPWFTFAATPHRFNCFVYCHYLSFYKYPGTDIVIKNPGPWFFSGNNCYRINNPRSGSKGKHQSKMLKCLHGFFKTVNHYINLVLYFTILNCRHYLWGLFHPLKFQ